MEINLENNAEEIIMGKKMYIGIDMGTSSVGIAVTDEKYNLYRVKGKDFKVI